MQTTLLFFQNLLSEWYQFTLDNELYAICLAVFVWLLTAIFYSFRIGFLNRRNRLNLAALGEAQQGLEAAQQQIKQLQEETAANMLQLERAKNAAEQEAQRVAALHERIALFNKQLIEGIQTLAPQTESAGHVSPVADNLETEGLWQHYSAAIQQLSERLRTEQQTKADLQQAYRSEIAKLAEKDLELSTLQARLDTQAQQFAQFELIIEEHKTQLKQQESAAQRLSEAQLKHQADLARLALLEQQALEWAKAPQLQAAQEEQPKSQETQSAQPEQALPIETVQTQPQPAIIEETAEPAQTEIERTVVAESVTPDAPEEPKAQSITKPSGDAGGKFKHFFAGAKQKIEKLDEKFTGRNNPVTEPAQKSEADEEPEALVFSPSEPSGESQAIATANAPSSVSGKFKNLFAGGKGASVGEKQALTEKPIPASSIEKEQPPLESSGDQTAQSAGAGKRIPTSVKNLFGKFKRK